MLARFNQENVKLARPELDKPWFFSHIFSSIKKQASALKPEINKIMQFHLDRN